MSARKALYVEGQNVYICGRHVLHGWKGVVIGKGNYLGSWYVRIKGKRWLIAGRNLSDKLVKATRDYPLEVDVT